MSDPAVNCTLEISCTVGSLDNALEALEEGADINCRSGAPLFNAIFNRNLEIIRMLIDKGADLSLFLSAGQLKALGGDVDRIVDALIACAPPDPDAIDVDAMEEFDEELREKGLEAPAKSGDWDGLVRYAEKLDKIGATAARECLLAFIDLLKPAKEFGDAALFESIKAEKKKIAALSDRYREEAEDIGNLAQFYLSTQASGSGDDDNVSAETPAADDDSAGGDGDERPTAAAAVEPEASDDGESDDPAAATKTPAPSDPDPDPATSSCSSAT